MSSKRIDNILESTAVTHITGKHSLQHYYYCYGYLSSILLLLPYPRPLTASATKGLDYPTPTCMEQGYSTMVNSGSRNCVHLY